MARRLEAMGQPRYRNGFNLTLHRDLVSLPLKWKKAQMIFVNSMSDLFHEDVPTEFIRSVFDTMNLAAQHTFQVLTKRSFRLRELSKDLVWTDNIWMGVTVETVEYAERIEDLLRTDARVKFLSLEPLLGSLRDVSLQGVDWIIAGGESGPGARPMDAEWVTEIRDQCLDLDIPFFFKQWGGIQKKKAGRVLEGREWDEMPVGDFARQLR
jgi:protein gp37